MKGVAIGLGLTLGMGNQEVLIPNPFFGLSAALGVTAFLAKNFVSI